MFLNSFSNKISDFLFASPNPLISLSYNHNISSNYLYLVMGGYLAYRSYEAFNNVFNNKIDDEASDEKSSLNTAYQDEDNWKRSTQQQKASDLFSGIFCGIGALLVFNFSFINVCNTPRWTLLGSFVAAEAFCYNSHVYAKKSELYDRICYQQSNMNNGLIIDTLNFFSNLPCFNLPYTFISSIGSTNESSKMY